MERTRGVDQGFQGAFGDLFGEEPGGVVGAGAGPEGALGDVEGAGEDDDRIAAQVLADEAVEGQQALDQGVVAGDGVQAGLGLGALVAGERGQLQRQCTGEPMPESLYCSASLAASVSAETCAAAVVSSVLSGTSSSRPSLPIRPTTVSAARKPSKESRPS